MLIYAHRGASKQAPENTLAAFKLALDQKSDGIELDVYQHGTELLVIHDCWLDRTTSGSGHIDQYSFKELRQLNAGDGQTIPTLVEVLALINGKCKLNIEVKGLNNTALLLSHIQLASAKYNFKQSDILISSFDHPLLRDIKQALPEIAIGALCSHRGLHPCDFALQLRANTINFDVNCLTLNMIEEAHANNLHVLVYTVDREEQIKQLCDWEVDGIFTNTPEFSRHIVKIHYKNRNKCN